MTTAQTFETIAAPEPDAWICACGNTPESDGFHPCLANGEPTEPTTATWDGLYVCGRCDRIMDQSTRAMGRVTVVGRRPRLQSYLVEIDAPVLIRLVARGEEAAEARGNALYADLWETLQDATARHAERVIRQLGDDRDVAEIGLGARYDDTEVSVEEGG